MSEKNTGGVEVTIKDFSKRSVIVLLEDDSVMDKWNQLLGKVGGSWNKSETYPGWIVQKTKMEELEKIIEENTKENEDGESESDSDDELIQQALARRIMSESTHKEIELEEVDNSDTEDVVSLCRRMRYLYSVIKRQRKLIEDLTNKTMSDREIQTEQLESKPVESTVSSENNTSSVKTVNPVEKKKRIKKQEKIIDVPDLIQSEQKDPKEPKVDA